MTQDTRHFAEELDELKQRLLVMGGLAEERLRTAVHALVERDGDLMAEVIRGDEAVNSLHLEIDDRCFKLLALHQPMAVDLRTIVAAFKINTDLERVGDLAVNVAEAAERYVTHAPVKPLIDLPRMAEMARQMLHGALDAFVSKLFANAPVTLAVPVCPVNGVDAPSGSVQHPFCVLVPTREVPVQTTWEGVTAEPSS